MLCKSRDYEAEGWLGPEELNRKMMSGAAGFFPCQATVAAAHSKEIEREGRNVMPLVIRRLDRVCFQPVAVGSGFTTSLGIHWIAPGTSRFAENMSLQKVRSDMNNGFGGHRSAKRVAGNRLNRGAYRSKSRFCSDIQMIRVPPAKLIQAQSLLIQGHSQREIGRTLHISPMTVAKVAKSRDFQTVIQDAQQRLIAQLSAVVDCVIDGAKRDPYLGYKLLKDLGVIAVPDADFQTISGGAATADEALAQRQIACIATALSRKRAAVAPTQIQAEDTAWHQSSFENCKLESITPGNENGQ
jgi:hypothetical protein